MFWKIKHTFFFISSKGHPHGSLDFSNSLKRIYYCQILQKNSQKRVPIRLFSGTKRARAGARARARGRLRVRVRVTMMKLIPQIIVLLKRQSKMELILVSVGTCQINSMEMQMAVPCVMYPTKMNRVAGWVKFCLEEHRKLHAFLDQVQTNSVWRNTGSYMSAVRRCYWRTTKMPAHRDHVTYMSHPRLLMHPLREAHHKRMGISAAHPNHRMNKKMAVLAKIRLCVVSDISLFQEKLSIHCCPQHSASFYKTFHCLSLLRFVGGCYFTVLVVFIDQMNGTSRLRRVGFNSDHECGDLDHTINNGKCKQLW